MPSFVVVAEYAGYRKHQRERSGSSLESLFSFFPPRNNEKRYMLLYLVVFVTYSVGIGQATTFRIASNLINSALQPVINLKSIINLNYSNHIQAQKASRDAPRPTRIKDIGNIFKKETIKSNDVTNENIFYIKTWPCNM